MSHTNVLKSYTIPY